MKKNTQEKMLIEVNENSFFIKLKKFFHNLFIRDAKSIEINNIVPDNNVTHNNFLNNIKNIDNEETKLLKLQKQYRLGQIKENELSKEQISSLCMLYDKQIAELKKSNEYRMQKILEYRKNKYN